MSHEEERQLSSHIKKWCLHLINTPGPRQRVERKQLTFPTCLSLYFTYNLIWIWIQYRRKVNIAWHLSAISQDHKHIKCRTFVKRWLSKLSIFATSLKNEKIMDLKLMVGHLVWISTFGHSYLHCRWLASSLWVQVILHKRRILHAFRTWLASVWASVLHSSTATELRLADKTCPSTYSKRADRIVSLKSWIQLIHIFLI